MSAFVKEEKKFGSSKATSGISPKENSGAGSAASNAKESISKVLSKSELLEKITEKGAKLTQNLLSTHAPGALKYVPNETVEKETVFIFAVIVLIMFFSVFGAHGILVDLVAVAYPACKSFLAVESTDKADQSQWLAYWMIWSSFKLSCYPFGFIYKIIPFFPLIECAGAVFLYHPDTLYALKLYKALRPMVIEAFKAEETGAKPAVKKSKSPGISAKKEKKDSISIPEEDETASDGTWNSVESEKCDKSKSE